MSDLAQRIAALSPEKRALLIQRMLKDAREHAPSPIPAQANLDGRPLPLSSTQERFWFLYQLDPNSPAYNVPLVVRMTPTLNVAALEQSLNELVNRHQSLRTIFEAVDDQAVQVILPSLAVPLPVIDLREMSETERSQEIKQLVRQEAITPFNLTTGPLLRTTLLHLPDEYHLIMNMHHIVTDDGTMGVIVNEVGQLYDAFSQGNRPQLPPPPIQYVDYALWQREQTWEEELAYWTDQLGGTLPLLNLPTDRPRTAVQSLHGARYEKTFPVGLTGEVKKLARQEGVTLFMMMLAAFKVLLYRYTNQTDICVGSPVANRTRPELQGLVGCIVNTLVLRSDLSDNPSFRAFLQRVQKVALSAYQHSDLPFEELVRALRPERNPHQTPLFQVLLELQDPADKRTRRPGEILDILEVDTETSWFDLTMLIDERDDAFVLTLVYNKDLFKDATIQRIADHYQAMLNAIVADPDQSLATLNYLTDSERHQLINVWNDTECVYPFDSTITDLLEAQVVQTPQATAVRFGTESLTYTELNRRANQLAHYLQSFGVGPDVPVGIFLERSPEMIVGLMGILKAGGAYVPLDPSYPDERLVFMLQDAQISVLLTQKILTTTLPEMDIPVICLDSDWQQIAGESEDNPAISVQPKNLAYIIYTSGSTGRPKGVMVTHQNLVHSTVARMRYYHEPVTAFLLLSSFAFDSSVVGIFWTLCQGGQLVLPQPGLERDPVRLLASLGNTEISHLLTLPTFYGALLELGAPAQFDSLRMVMVAGEACPVELAAQHYRQLAHAKLANEYGPTEGTVWSTVYNIDSPKNGSSVPIGRPIDNVQAYLLDSYLHPVPVNIPGELYIGGDGLARGYLERPGLTAEKFIPNPFGDNPGSRLYKTGDLVRYQPDGNIEFLGRTDYQVKIRGYRIELGEIESILQRHHSVQEAVLVARKAESNHKQLIAYVVPDLNDGEAASQITANEHIAHWEMVYDDLHAQPAHLPDPTFNVIGWNSSYTGLPIPEPEMAIWVQQTVDRILAWQPRQVLEIGCGTGLLLFRIAPHCTSYSGADFAQGALEHIQQHLPSAGLDPARVKLWHRRADDLEGFRGSSFDTVILNSVVQYFPDIDYLLGVLEGVLEIVESGGRIFIGDVRSLPLLEAFHTSVQLHRSPASLPTAILAQRSSQAVHQDKELVIDPAFFAALKHHFPKISHVEMQLKRGRQHNELTKFRYDVVLHVGEKEAPIMEPVWLDWQQEALTVADARHYLEQELPPVLGIRHVPNVRLTYETRLVTWLADNEGPSTAADIQAALQTQTPSGEDPETFWALSDELPYEVNVSWSGSDAEGCYDILFRRSTAESGRLSWTSPAFAQDEVNPRPWCDYANNPLKGQQTVSVTGLSNYLEERLPDYMVPTAFVMLTSLPRHPNGKVNRQALPAPEKEHAAPNEAYVAPNTPQEKILVDIWKRVLGRERVGIHDNFFELGGDSILSIRILARANQAGLKLTSIDLFKYQTIAELANVSQNIPDIRAEQAIITGQAPLTAIQHWFFEQDFPDPHHWNLPALLTLQHSLRPALLAQAIQTLLAHHDALRLRFVRSMVGWQQSHSQLPDTAPLTIIDLSAVPASAQQSARLAALGQAQASLDLSAGSLFHAVLFDLGSVQPAQLLLVAHHLTTDFVSLQILLTDLETACQQLMRGQAVQLPRKTTSFKYWAEEITRYAQTDRLATEREYWLNILQSPEPVLPLDFPDGISMNTRASACEVETWLSTALTDVLLHEVPQAYHTQMNDVLLTALVQAFANWTGQSRLLFDLEGHGREDIGADVDISRTVGWFTTIFPVLLELETRANPGQALKSIKEQLRGIPKRGIGYGLLRYLGGKLNNTADIGSNQQASWSQPQISFNYLGQYKPFTPSDTVFQLSSESSGPWYSPQGHRTHLIDVQGLVVNDQLRMSWIYSRQIHRQSTIEELANHFEAALQTLIEHCRRPETGGFTPSDFPLASLNQKQLDKLLARKQRSQSS